MTWDSLIDLPILKEEHDELNLGTFAIALTRFIDACETPLTIGIQGDWGIGKTSLLRMVENKLPQIIDDRRYKDRCSVRSLYLNTWQYAQFTKSEHLTLSLMQAILKKVDTLSNGESPISTRLKQHMMTIFRFTGTLFNQAIKKEVGVDAIEAGKQASSKHQPVFQDLAVVLENFKSEFAQLIKSITKEGEKIVLMIDDLDRLRPSSALDILEAIKNFLDVPRCVFILAIDNSIIQQGVMDKFGVETQKAHGKSFFDKIIQVPFNMPVAAYDIERYTLSLLGWKTLDKDRYKKKGGKDYFLSVADKRAKRILGREDVVFFSKVSKIVATSNPRSIKRIANYANLLKMVYEQKEAKSLSLREAKLIYALACLQMQWPEILQFLAENPSPATLGQLKPEIIENHSFFHSLMDRHQNRQGLFTRIQSFFDVLIDLLDSGERDGKLSTTEFEPLWQMMVATNLTKDRLRNLDSIWAELEKQDEVVIRLFRRSNFDEPLSCKLIPRLGTVCSLYWNEKEVGYLTTSKGPVRFFINTHVEEFAETELKDYVHKGTYYNRGHSRVNLKALVANEKGLELLNQVHEIIC